jgi:hypothetical protein
VIRRQLLTGRWAGELERQSAMAFFIHPNQCLLFFTDPAEVFTAERMKQVLAAEGVTAAGEAEPFALQWSGGPKLFAAIVRGEVAQLLAKRLMERRSRYRAQTAAIDAYIEIKFECLEEVLDEINTLIVVQSALQAATSGLLYRSWNRTFSGPEE